ncbi:MAG: hypothetical protein MJZ64_03850 [Paludibacteraceae bacterium]|nr:hypothetical protein [Paludibacteraceae bacterium]
MKKILTLFSALLLTVSMWGAYTITTVENFTAVPQGDKLLLTFNAVESSSNHYYYDICFEITPSVNDFVGTFSKSDGTLSTTNSRLNWIYNQSATNPGKLRTGRTLYSSSSQSITIEKVGEDSYTITGQLNARAASESSDKVYNFSNIPFSIYGSEPAKEVSAIDMSGKTLSMTSWEDETPMTFKITDRDYYTIFLQMNVAEYAQPTAGTTFLVAASGNNTIQSSCGQNFLTGNSKITYLASYYEDYGGWDPYYYFITGGSLTVTYSQDNKTMTLAGTLTTAHGTEIIVNSTMNNPWYVPEPETIDLVVSKVDPTYYSSDGEWILALTATPNNFVIDFSAANLVDASISNIIAQYTYVDLGGYETSTMDATKTEVNALSIVATGNPNEYKLNATIVCKNKNTYVMKDVVFTYTAPTPWDAEPEYVEGGIEFTSTSLTKTFSNQKQRFSFQDNDYNRIVLEFKTPTDVAPTAGNHTIVNPDVATPANGDVLGSQGYMSYTQYPSYYYNYDEYAYYYFRSGIVNVAYSQDNKTITMTGTLTTAHGTEITFICTGDNPWGPKEVYVNVDHIDASVTAVGLNFDVVGDVNVPEIMLAVNGTQANPLALLGTYGYDKFDSWNLIYTKTSYTYMTTGSSVTISDEEGQIMLNATLIGTDGYTYYIEDAPITYSMAVSEATDQTALLNRAMNATIDLTIQRSFVDGMWQTICLPFDIANVAESPLAGATVKSVTNCSLEGETLLVEAEDVTSMTAGMPYLIKWESGAPENPVFEGVTIKTTEGATSGNFVANLNAKQIEDVAGKYMVVYDNGLAPMGAAGSVKGFRAYFQLPAASVPPRKFAFVKNQATGTETPAAEMQNAKMLINGQLMLFSGDNVYNAQAQELK